MDKTPPIPERYSSLMPTDRRDRLGEQRQRHTSHASQLSAMSTASSTVSEFLEEKIKLCQGELDYMKSYKEGLHEAKCSEKLDRHRHQEELDRVLANYQPRSEELKILKRQRRIVHDDLEDEIAGSKRPREEGNDPDVGFLERAYTNAIVPRIMSATSKQKKSKFRQSEFKRAVLDYYGARDEGCESIWCHLTGWREPEMVKAAHLVPKSLSGEEISYLFGVGEIVLYDPRNGITLHKKLEHGLDSGTIAIIPVPSDVSEKTRWKCILLDENMRKDTVYHVENSTTRWGDLDGRELTFLTDNRPARRFLYFRFIITYIHATISGNTRFTDKVENKTEFWASPGEYLRRSTLVSLARNISGLKLPPSLYDDNTFETPDESTNEDAENIAMDLSSELRSAMIESAKSPTIDDDDEEEVDDEEEGCD